MIRTQLPALPGVLAAALALISGTLASARAQDRPLFRSTAELVRLQVAAFGPDGRAVTDLTAADFVIREEGEEMPVSVFLSPGERPTQLAIVLDTSGSMERWPTIEGTRRFLDGLEPDTCVVLLPFKETVEAAIWGRPGDALLAETLDHLQLDGAEAIYDALLTALWLSQLRVSPANPVVVAAESRLPSPADVLWGFRLPRPRALPATLSARGSCPPPLKGTTGVAEPSRGVVVITDGQDHRSTATLDDVLLSAWGSGIPFYTLAIARVSRTGRFGTTVTRGLHRLAEHSGGFVIEARVFQRGSPRDFLRNIERLQQAIRGQYTLGYVPAPPGQGLPVVEERSIDVEVTRPGVEVLTVGNLVLGRGQSSGAAFQRALDGFADLNARRLDAAEMAFAAATSLDPGLGMGWFGQALLEQENGDLESARTTMQQAAELAPWIPGIDARLARLQLRLGDTDAAWARARRAYAAGTDVDDLLAELQAADPRPFDPSYVGDVVRVNVHFDDLRPAGAIVAPEMIAAIAAALDAVDGLEYSPDGTHAYRLIIGISEAHPDDNGLEVRGDAVLRTPEGDDELRERFRLQETFAPGTLGAFAGDLVARISATLAQKRAEQRQR